LQSPIVAELFGLRSHGALLGIVAFITTVGAAIGPVLTGRLFDTTGNYQLAFIVLTAIAITGLILTLRLRPISR